MKNYKHLCSNCSRNFATCKSSKVIFGIDKNPNARGLEADKVVECDAYMPNMCKSVRNNKSLLEEFPDLEIAHVDVKECYHSCDFFRSDMDGMYCGHPIFKKADSSYDNMIITQDNSRGRVPDECPLRNKPISIFIIYSLKEGGINGKNNN